MIGFLYPELCNQQGDQGYKDWLDLNGIPTVDLRDEEVDSLSGVVIGDVSERASQILSEKLDGHWLLGRLQDGLTVLAIGRAARVVGESLGIELNGGSYLSSFVETDFQGLKLYGYVNGLVDVKNLVTERSVGAGRFITCDLLGPVGVINPNFETHCFGIKTKERADLLEHYKKLVAD